MDNWCLRVEVIVCGPMTNSSRVSCGAWSPDSQVSPHSLLLLKPIDVFCPHAQCPSLSEDMQGGMVGLSSEELCEFTPPVPESSMCSWGNAHWYILRKS